MATLEQRRAQFALEKIDGVKNDTEKRAKYKTQLLKLPARLHTSGMGQTVAFYLAEGNGSPEATICGWLGTWLHEVGIYEDGDLIRSITGSTPKLRKDEERTELLYRQASAEARALAVWLKRFAEAFLAEERKQ